MHDSFTFRFSQTLLAFSSLCLWSGIECTRAQRYKGIEKEVGGRDSPAWIIAHLYIYNTGLQPGNEIHMMFKGTPDHRDFLPGG